MQQNAQYGAGFYTTQPPVAPDYGAPYAPHLATPYTSAPPAYDPPANPPNPPYNLVNAAHTAGAPVMSADDPTFRLLNAAYSPSDAVFNVPTISMPTSYSTAYEQPASQNPNGPPAPAPAVAHERAYDYGSNFLPHSVSSPPFLQVHGLNPGYGSNPNFGSNPEFSPNHELYRSSSYHEPYTQAGYYVSPPQGAGYEDRGTGAMVPANLPEYNQNKQVFYEGAGYDRLGFEQIEAYGQMNHEAGSQENYDYAGVYAYDGGQAELYGSRGTRSTQSSSILNPLVTSGNDANVAKSSVKLDGGGSGGSKYRVKLLPESNMSDPPIDCICQIGLDGVRLVVPTTNKTLRIYPLETIIKWEVSDSSTLTFWAKTLVDAEQRRIRLQSNSYSTSVMLDTLTAACVQLSEMIDKDNVPEASKGVASTSGSSEPGVARKSSFADWVTLKPKVASQEEKQHWVPDEAVKKCTSCGAEFGAFNRRHHCRNCGDIFCDKCTRGRTPLTSDQDSQPVRVCDACLAEVTQRLLNVDLSSRTTHQQPREDLARKLQEEMDRTSSRKPSKDSTDNQAGSLPVHTARSDSFSLSRPPHLWKNQPIPKVSGPQMREVACPTCTVHLQVQVPSFGTETVECGVCQHPFLVSA